MTITEPSLDRAITVRVVDNPFEPKVWTRTEHTRAVCEGTVVADVLPERVRPEGSWVVIEHGRVIPPEEWHQHVVQPGGELVCLRAVRGNIGRVVAGAVMAVIWIATAVSLLMGGVQGLIAGAPGTPQVPAMGRGDQDSSPTYGFGVISNATRRGSPIGVVYGEHRVGGQFIQYYVKPQDDSDVLFVLIGMGEGPIASISDVQINEQPLENYRSVFTEQRLGENDQTAIPL